MKLNSHEVGTPLFQKLKEHYEEKLAKCRARIEVPSITESERMKLAWTIRAHKDFLALG